MSFYIFSRIMFNDLLLSKPQNSDSVSKLLVAVVRKEIL